MPLNIVLLAPLPLLVGFVAILVLGARRGERGWTRPLAVLFAALVIWLVGMTAFVLVLVLTTSPRDL